MILDGDTMQHLSYWQDAWNTIKDPAHITAELVFNLVFDGLIIGVGWKLVIKRYLDDRLRRVHVDLDAEHGIEYHEPGDEQWREPEITDPAYGIRNPGLAEDVRRSHVREGRPKPLTAEQRRRMLDPFVKERYIARQRAKQDEP